MMQVIIPYLGGLRADCWSSESHERKLEVTENPVEFGAAVNDHAFRKPQELTIEFGVSNTPLNDFNSDWFGEFGTDRVSRARELLFLMQDEKALLRVETLTGGAYENMLLAGISWRTDNKTPQSALFTLTLKELRIVSTQTVKYKPKASHKKTTQQTKKRTDSGEKPAKQPDKAKQEAAQKALNESFADQLVDFFTSRG